ncbi:unnamed protein product [Adineta ricciae]|uniref:VASt domain-containing protein n=1 Tax=Adineta ricciae TaxID=249248 RepID=A0A815P1D1_ADIRI|nr:unnamed protein product [Adineta ricciae]
MAFSLKKRSRSKSQALLVDSEQSKSLGEVLHRSTKTKKKDKNSLRPKEIPVPSNDAFQSNGLLIPTDQPVLYRNRCPCETHHEKELIERNYEITVDKLFDLIFGSNEFVRTYRRAQRFYDDTATEWAKNPATNYRERMLNYKVPYESTFIGKGTICTRERQILFHEVSGSHYMVETEVSNEGVKFSDTFSLIIRFCLVQTSITTTKLCVTAHIVYNKAVMGFIKQIIERNAYSASLEGLKDLSSVLKKIEKQKGNLFPRLDNRLDLISNFKIEQRRLSRNETIVPVSPTENVRRMSLSSRPDNLLVPVVLNDVPAGSTTSDKLICIALFL